MAIEEQIESMRNRITDEVYYAFFKKRTGRLRRLVKRIVHVPTTRFSRIFAEADDRVIQEGLPGAGKSLINSLNVSVNACGYELIPEEGPLVVVSNHPGAYDSPVLSSLIPRPDLKIIAFEVPFYHTLPNISRQIIYATDDVSGRMLALRNTIQHLRDGGSVLVFGTGKIDPDPAVQTGSESTLADWSSSIEIMLRKVQNANLVLAIVSGVLQRQFVYHPLTYFHRSAMDRRRLAEFLQIMQQLVWPDSIHAHVNLTFAPPVSSSELAAESNNQRMIVPIISRAQSLLATHLGKFSGGV
jgi:hypothetical protein